MSDDKNDDLFYDAREWNNIKSWEEDGWSCTLIQALSAWSPGDVIENTHSTVNLIKHARAEILRLRAENEKLREALIGLYKPVFENPVEVGSTLDLALRAAAAAIRESGNE